MSYNAIVCKIKTHPHPDADRIQLGVVVGYQVVVGLNVQDGDLGVYFPTDGQLSHEMCMANKLYSKHPETGEPMGGFFSAKRRVSTQRFRGEKSEGFWCPLSYLDWVGVHNLKEGDEFCEIGGKPVCNKYITPATARAQKNVQQNKTPRKSTRMFKEHFDTSHWARFATSKIPVGAVVYTTEKQHGTSGRTGRLLVEHPLPHWKAQINYWTRRTIFKKKEEWSVLTGSRRVTFYGDTSWREKISHSLSHVLKKGETIYYEIVGWDDKGALIMGSTPSTKELVKQGYPKTTTWSYGQEPGTWGIYVYRITMTNEDGDSVELSWPQVVARCKEMDIKHVPELDRMMIHGPDDIALLEETVEKLTDGPSTLTNQHIREGVCVRIEHEDMNITLKSKAYEFKVMEGILKEADDYVDSEEAEQGNES